MHIDEVGKAPELDPSGTSDQTEEPHQSIFAIGELVGDTYEIRELLGEGGMGQVFEAFDHLLHRRVAIKAAWPNPNLPTLRNEARALAAFQHPSLVTVHTLGEHRGIDYIVMERIYGVSLKEHVAHRKNEGIPFSPQEVIEPLIAIAEGLSVVHRAGIAHRDVKPENIMLTPDHRIVLMDFGLVLPEHQIASQNVVAGSPPYMAPEALVNSTAPGAGHLIDLYALGVIGFEMLTGERPYDATSVPALWDLMQAAPAPQVDAFREDVPPALSAVIRELMHQDPAARPQSAEGLAWLLKQIRDGRATAASTEPGDDLDVLIVEDDKELARVLHFYAKKALGDVHARFAADGEKAIERMREKEPDIILLDIHMPKMNGIEVCMYMRGERLAEDASIISVSAGAQQHDVQLLHQLGIHHFVPKGVDLGKRLGEILREVCGLSNTVRPPALTRTSAGS